MSQATQSGRQAAAHLPPREGSNLMAQATQSGRQALSFPLGKEVVYLRQAVRLPRPPRQLLPSQVLPFPPGQGSNLVAQVTLSGRQASTLLPLGEGCILSQAGSQALQAVTSQPGTLLPPGEGSNLVAQVTQSGRHAGAHLPPAGENSSLAGNNLPTSQAGSQVTRSGRQNPRHSARQRALQASQGNSTASQADSTGTWDGNPHLTPPDRLPQGSSPEDPNPKWVINLSSKPLTPAQRSVLAKGPNFAVAPKQPPNLEYITAIEAACTKLSQQDAEELRAEVNRVLRSSHPPKPNLTKAQNLGLRELKRDRDCIVLTTNKGVAMVIMDIQDYISKSNSLLNQNTYRSIPRDPTNSIKNKLISILKRVKN